MRLSNIFNFNKPCQHTKVFLGDDYSYCPDCGELIKTHWYITRCSCCGLKMRASLKDGEVIAEHGFCNNCGSTDYIIEEIDTIDCVNINFAIAVKKVVKSKINEYEQVWVDKILPKKMLELKK